MSVYANSRSIVHKGDGQTNTAPAPDVCKTPSPGGPVPIPYPNIAQNSDLASGSKKTKIGGNSIGHESANLSTSTGDEAGTAGGGIVSSKTKGKLTWTVTSTDVKVEGKGVARFMDPTMHNGNMGNVPGVEIGAAGPSYGSDFVGECAICDKAHDAHPKVESSDERPTAKHVITLVEKLGEDHTADKAVKLRELEAEASRHKAEAKAAAKEKEKAKAERVRYNAEVAAGNEQSAPLAAEQHQLFVKYLEAEQAAEAKRKEVRAKADALDKEIRTSGVCQGGRFAYMVGAMMCETHPPTVFVSASGENTPGFTRVANSIANFVPVNKAGGVKPADYQKKNSALNDPAKFEKFQKDWDRLQLATEKKELEAPDPGVCAAQHLLAHEGHVPRALTEAWFDPTTKNPMSVRWVRDAEEFYQDLKAKLSADLPSNLQVNWTAVAPREFVHGQHVPSCQVCQALLPFLLCEEKKECG
jgi:hypothetical protein